MTLNYRGSKYEVQATSTAAVVSRKGTYRGVALDFPTVDNQIKSARPLTYRGASYQSA